MAKIALLLDEDVRPMLGEVLRQRGYDVIHVLVRAAQEEVTPSNWRMPSASSARSSRTTFDISGSLAKNTMKKAGNTSESCFRPRCR